MILLSFIFSSLENIIMSITLKNCFQLQSKLRIIIITLVSSLFMTYIKSSDPPHFVVVFFPIISYTILITLEFKDFHFSYFAFPTILIFLLLFADSIGYMIASVISEIPDINFKPNGEFLYSYSLLSNLVYILLCIGFYYITYRNRDDIKIKNSLALAMAMFLLIMMFTNLLESVIFTNFSIYTIYSLMIEFIILSLLIFYLYSSMHKQAKENLEINKKLLRIQYQDQMYSIVNNLNNQINADKHMMTYNLLKIKHMLNDNDIEEIKTFVDKEINKINKYKYIASTNNLLFDHSMTYKINQLIEKNIDVKIVLMIDKHNELLEDQSLIELILNYIDFFCSYPITNLQIFIEEKNDNYIIFKIITITDHKIDKIIHYNHPKIKKINHKNENKYKELSILIG